MKQSSISYKLKKIDPKNLSEQEWEDYLDHYEAMHWEEFPNYPDPARKKRRQELEMGYPFYTPHRWFVYVNDSFVGYAFLGYENEQSPSYQTNGHLVELHISLDQQFRRKGIGKQIFDELIDFARREGKTRLTIWTPNSTGKNFAQKLGGQLDHEHFVNKLELADVDWDLMKRWIDDSLTLTPEVSIESYHEIPDDLIEDFVQLHTETENQAPWGGDGEVRMTTESRRKTERLYRDEGIDLITMISKESNGEISGMTEMVFNPNDPTSIQQELTGVRHRYRGRGLGKRLKAEMISLVRSKYPSVVRVSTGNAKTNAAMLHINTEMGFEEQAIFHLYHFDL
jgi:GNAT superfamily N-acetyltransferase